MKITITGSLGHISKPLTETLVQKGHAVTVISSKADKKAAIEALGAIAGIVSLEDADFLAATFNGADAVYTMVPPVNYFDPTVDVLAYYRRIGNNYAKAIGQSGVKRVVNLSSVGADLSEGTGVIIGAHNVEGILNKLSGVTITHLRPTSFYYNLLSFIPAIKNAGVITSNYGAGDEVPFVSPVDIAAVVAEELESPVANNKVRYITSEELTGNEVAAILGAAIGKPDLKWVIIPDEEMKNTLEGFGMPKQNAAGLVELNASIHTGKLFGDYYRNKPAVMGKIKLKEFAKEFAVAFKEQ